MKSDQSPSGGKEEGEDILVHILLRPVSRYFAKFFILLHLKPNIVSLLGLFVAFIAGYFFYLGDRTSLIYGAVITYITLILSATDGEVARLTHQQSKFGEFFDSSLDVTKFWLLFFSLSVGVYRTMGDVQTMLFGQFAGGAFLVGHYMRVYSYRIMGIRTFELKFTKRFVFYFTIFIAFAMIIAAILNMVKPFLIAMAVIYPLTWLKKMHTVYKFMKRQQS